METTIQQWTHLPTHATALQGSLLGEGRCWARVSQLPREETFGQRHVVVMRPQHNMGEDPNTKRNCWARVSRPRPGFDRRSPNPQPMPLLCKGRCRVQGSP